MRADETARGFGCYRQSHRTHRRGHRHADRPAGPTGNRARQTPRPARGFEKEYPKMYVLMDGVQVPVVAAETVGRTGRIEGQRARTRESKVQGEDAITA